MKTKSLTFRIFLSIIFVGILVYFLCALIFISNMYNYFEKQIFSELETESSFLEKYLEKSAETSTLSSSLKELSNSKTIKNRITLIHADGTVFFDNQVNFKTLENHSLRQEFIQAKQNGSAKISRFSSTMTNKTLYFAKLLPSGDVLRISCNQHSVLVLLLGMSQALFFMLIFAVIISGVFATWISKKIVNPLNKIDLENPEKSLVYEELKPFTKRIAEENFEKSQREELRKQFSANVSHELKTPLTSISGFAEILKSGETDKKTTIDFASTIYEESQRMINLVNDIIKLSKLDEKSITLQKEKINLFEIAGEASRVLSSSAKSKNIKIRIFNENNLVRNFGDDFGDFDSSENSLKNFATKNFTNNSADFTADFADFDSSDKSGEKSGGFSLESFAEKSFAEKNQANIFGVRAVIYEMIYNLIDNAIKYNKQNGFVDIIIKNENLGKKIIFIVKDSGIGIPKNEQERIFERFYRVDKSRSKELGGTGLGLSIVKHAAKYHNAKITVNSQEGKGSTFSVEFESL